jgi:hypothetical protein
MSVRAAGVIGLCVLLAALILALVPRPGPGRYQLQRHVLDRGDNKYEVLFLLDTQTGRVWQGSPKRDSMWDYEWFEQPSWHGAPPVNKGPR